MGLLACLVSVLLIGVVIGRATYRAEGPTGVYLNNAPTQTTGKAEAASGPTADSAGDPTPQPQTSQPSASGLDASRAERSSMVPVAKTPLPLRGRPTPKGGEADPSRRPSNTIEGSSGGGPASLLTPGGQDGGAGNRSSLGSIENAVIRLVNQERRRAGCVPLYVDPRLVRSARAHSAEMAATNRLSHSSSNGDTPWKRMEAAGYRNGGAENIARGYHTAEEAVRGWMSHSAHRANILNCLLTATGVGVTPGPGGPWWTQDFGYS
ncbi:CAP domain-containing protein [Thermopolyspora sp. NPDC052614]|uniref:CAP domain-containing protein n=1 Tax=Thermopolyspora sp. NPDC052614 TaxID=3155682 RepID=UPI0034165AA2